LGREGVEVVQAEVERLPAPIDSTFRARASRSAFKQAGLLDERDQVREQVPLERGERWRLFGNRVPRHHVLRGQAVGQDDQHRHCLLVGVEVIEDHDGRTAARPLVLVDAEEIGDLLGGVSVVDALDGESAAVFQNALEPVVLMQLDSANHEPRIH
jgi:hypothetical protein